MPASEVAKKAAGTFVLDTVGSLPTVMAWVTQECRQGALAGCVKVFCEAQEENLEQSAVIVEAITADAIQCCIPCRCFDCESTATFGMEVRFSLDPKTGACRRI